MHGISGSSTDIPEHYRAPFKAIASFDHSRWARELEFMECLRRRIIRERGNTFASALESWPYGSIRERGEQAPWISWRSGIGSSAAMRGT
jgi:hypothetical protein